MASLWGWAATEYAAFWPVAVPSSFDSAMVAAMISNPGQSIYVLGSQDGFYIVRPGYLPEIAGVAAELVIWIVEPGLSPVLYRKALADLMKGWLTDEVARGVYEYGFGCMPANMPVKSLQFLEDWRGAGGVQRTTFDGPGGVVWYRYYGRNADALVLVT